jgi:hypothetical protein
MIVLGTLRYGEEAYRSDQKMTRRDQVAISRLRTSYCRAKHAATMNREVRPEQASLINVQALEDKTTVLLTFHLISSLKL